MGDPMEFSALNIVVLCGTALLTGISRTAIPGLGMLLSTLVALIMPVRASTGFILPMLLMADIMAVFHWRRVAAWRGLVRILPWAGIGIVCGYFIMGSLTDALFKPLLGGMIIVFVILDLVRRWTKADLKTSSRALAAVMGILAGIATMMANAAGPIMSVYLLSMDLRKEDFVGTNAWFFLIVNLAKLPFSAVLGLITWQHLKINAALLPLIVLGELAGVYLVKRISQKLFNTLAQALAAAAGLKLLF